MIPNLFIVGAPKCGTTAWYEYLRSHPSIYFPQIKEPHYFAFDFPLLRESASLPEYLSLFDQEKSATVRGDASVFYLYSNCAAEEIAKFNPNAKILVFLRDQEHFVASFHQQILFTFDEEMEDFEQAWDLSGRRPPETVPQTCRDLKILDYKQLGHIRDQLERYLAVFPAEQIGVVRFDDWVRDPRQMYLKILTFLGVADDGRTEFPPVNQARFHKSRRLGRFLQHPPLLVSWPKEQIKRILQVSSLGIADRIARFNREPGYTAKPGDELAQRIAEYYRASGQRIDQLDIAFL